MTDPKANSDDDTLCKRYECSLEELNGMVGPFEKMLLVREFPEPKNTKEETKKESVSVKALGQMLKDSPLIRMARMQTKQKPSTKEPSTKEPSTLLSIDDDW